MRRYSILPVLFAALVGLLQFTNAMAWTCVGGVPDTQENRDNGSCTEVRPTPIPTHVVHSTATATAVPTSTSTGVPTAVPTRQPTQAPTPTLTTVPVPTGVTPAEATPTPTTAPTQAPSAIPTPARSQATPVTSVLGGPPPGTTHTTDVCVYTLENGLVRVDVRAVRDSDRWVREHRGRPGLPNDFVATRGQSCGPTLLIPTSVPAPTTVPTVQPTVTPLATPTLVPKIGTALSLERTPAPAPTVEVASTQAVGSGDVPGPPVPVQVPLGLPNTGDGSTAGP